MNWFLNLDIGVRVAVISTIIAGIGLLIAIAQYFQSQKRKSDIEQSVKGKKNKTAQIGGDNAGDISIE